MKNVIVITGASSGFGALAARALARAGHTVYASMRETTGRNAPQVKEVEKYAAEHGVDLRAIELDVSQQESADAAIQTTIVRHEARTIEGLSAIKKWKTDPRRSTNTLPSPSPPFTRTATLSLRVGSPEISPAAPSIFTPCSVLETTQLHRWR